MKWGILTWYLYEIWMLTYSKIIGVFPILYYYIDIKFKRKQVQEIYVIRVYTILLMKSSIFWDITSCSPLNVNWRFGGTCCLHLQGRRISQARNQRESRWQAEQSACRNFGLYRKQERNGRQLVKSRWLARRAEWTASIHWPSGEPIGDKNRINSMALKRAVCAGLGKESEEVVSGRWAENRGVWGRNRVPGN
jgi:hypothetical protein